MTYKINGILLEPQPTTGKWVLPEVLDDDGAGRPIYSAVMMFEMMWQLAAPTLFAALLGLWRDVSASGTVVAELPQYNEDAYQFYAYSGTILERPMMDPYFEGHHTNVRMLVRNVRTLNVPVS